MSFDLVSQGRDGGQLKTARPFSPRTMPRHRLGTKRMLEGQKRDRPCQNVANFTGVLMVTHGSSGENQQTDTLSSSINPTRPLAVGDHTLN
jgi:hypothetical protein